MSKFRKTREDYEDENYVQEEDTRNIVSEPMNNLNRVRKTQRKFTGREEKRKTLRDHRR